MISSSFSANISPSMFDSSSVDDFVTDPSISEKSTPSASSGALAVSGSPSSCTLGSESRGALWALFSSSFSTDTSPSMLDTSPPFENFITGSSISSTSISLTSYGTLAVPGSPSCRKSSTTGSYSTPPSFPPPDTS